MSLGLCLAILGIAGCTSSTQRLYADGARGDRVASIIETPAFPIQVVLPKHSEPGRLRVYLEGDGKAWATRSQPSIDPTPAVALIARLAADDPEPAAYVARPCQYVMNDRCSFRVWTDRRFSLEAIDSVSYALDQVKFRTGATQLELVGYSGGGTVALLLAARRSDVISVQTLAGNLTPGAWVQFHRLSPLSGALEPSTFAERLRSIPQRHLVGQFDQVVTPSLAKIYREAVKPSCVEMAVVGASHSEGWGTAWAAYRDTPIDCSKDSVRTQHRP